VSFDYERDRRLFELEDEQVADIRFRRYLVGETRRPLEGGAPGARRRVELELALLAVDRRIARRAILLAGFGPDDDAGRARPALPAA
jgi:hypothetical protein